MLPVTVRYVALAWALLVLSGAAARGGGVVPPSSKDVPPQLRAYLDRYIHLTERELAALRRGEVVARAIETHDRREIAAFGLARIGAAPEEFIDGVRKLTWLRKSSVIVAAARFSLPPQVADLDGLVVDPQDISALGDCRIGDCDVRLSAEGMRRVQRDIDWRSPQAGKQAASVFKEILVDHARAYLQGGDAALPDFQDRAYPVRLAEEVREILARSPYLRDSSAELHEHLRTFPSSSLASAENILYWSKERFGAKPVVSMTHVTILKGGQAPTLIASKQIYASHYFDASLGLSAVFDVSTAEGPAFYLAYINRTRTRSLDSTLRSLARPMVRRRARDGVERMIRGLKTTLEKKQEAS
jgi:hypothetical protein